MFIVCKYGSLRENLLDQLEMSPKDRSDAIFDEFPVLPRVGNVVIAVNDVSECNLRIAIRYFLANAEKNVRLVVVKRIWSDDEHQRLEEIVKAEYQKAIELNEKNIMKISQLADSLWKNAWLEQLNKWRKIPDIQYTTFPLGTHLKDLLDNYFANYLDIDIHEDGNEITSKAPVLHWTPFPLDGEVQMIIRISFSLAGPDQAAFREICRSIKGISDTSYEWTCGILVTTDLTRIHIERVSNTTVEITGRISVDELEDEQAGHPMRHVWPYLSLALRNTLNILGEHPYLQYSIQIIPFGALFFQPFVETRVFDLTLFMGTACRYRKVAFWYHNQLYNIILDEVFPDGVYTSLECLLSLQPPSPKMSRPESVQDSIFPLVTDPLTPSALSVSHNRGRRVSFGTIKLMNESSAPTNGVDEYVDTMLKQTMDQLVSS